MNIIKTNRLKHETCSIIPHSSAKAQHWTKKSHLPFLWLVSPCLILVFPNLTEQFTNYMTDVVSKVSCLSYDGRKNCRRFTLMTHSGEEGWGQTCCSEDKIKYRRNKTPPHSLQYADKHRL